MLTKWIFMLGEIHTSHPKLVQKLCGHLLTHLFLFEVELVPPLKSHNQRPLHQLPCKKTLKIIFFFKKKKKNLYSSSSSSPHPHLLTHPWSLLPKSPLEKESKKKLDRTLFFLNFSFFQMNERGRGWSENMELSGKIFLTKICWSWPFLKAFVVLWI